MTDDLYLESLESSLNLSKTENKRIHEECRGLKNKCHSMRALLERARSKREELRERCKRQAEEIKVHKISLAKMRDERNEALATISKLEKKS